MLSLKRSTFFVVQVLLTLGCLDTVRAQNNSFQAVPSQLVFIIPQAGTIPGQSSAQFNLFATGPNSPVQFSATAPSWLSLTPASGTASSRAQPITATLTSAAATLGNGSY